MADDRRTPRAEPSAIALELRRLATSGAGPVRVAELLGRDAGLTQALMRYASAAPGAPSPAPRGATDLVGRLAPQELAALAIVRELAFVRELGTDHGERSASCASEATPPSTTHRSPYRGDQDAHRARMQATTAIAARSLARRQELCPEHEALLAGMLSVDDPDADRARRWTLLEQLVEPTVGASAPERLRHSSGDAHPRALCALLHTARLAGSFAAQPQDPTRLLELSQALTDRYGLPASGAVALLTSIAPEVERLATRMNFPVGPGFSLAALARDAALAIDAGGAQRPGAARRGPSDIAAERAWRPSVGAPSDGWWPAELARPLLLEALARRTRVGLPAPVGWLMLEVSPRAVEPHRHRLARGNDLWFALDAERCGLLAVGADGMGLRALGQRLAVELDRLDLPARSGGAACDGTRRPGEADLLMFEAAEALARSLSTSERHPVCRLAGLG
jgi:hypothetical protein